MDSGTNDLNSRERLRWGDVYKVYTRKGKRKAAFIADNDDGDPYAAAAAPQVSISNDDTENDKADVREPNLKTLASRGDCQEESDVQQPNTQTLESGGPKRPNQENEKRDARHHLVQANSELGDSLRVSSTRDAGHLEIVTSNGENRQDDGIGPVVESEGNGGCQPMVQDNHVDELDGSAEYGPLAQRNHIDKPDASLGCQDSVQGNCIGNPIGCVGFQSVVQDDKPDEHHECSPMAQDNHSDTPDRSPGCKPVVHTNNINKPNGSMDCQPMVQDDHTDEDECSEPLPIMQDGDHAEEPDGSVGNHQPVMQDNLIQEAGRSTQCQQPIVQEDSELPPSVKPSPIVTRVEDRVRINISGVRPADEIPDLMKKLESELYHVKVLVEKLEASEQHQLTAYANNTVDVGGIGSSGGNVIPHAYEQPHFRRSYVIKNRTLMRVNSEVGPVRHQFRPPSIIVTENNHGVGEFVEKEKRTPKANQFYTNAEFLLGKDRLPPESNKKSKPNGGARKKHGGEFGHGFGFGFGSEKQKNQVFRRCNALLQKLMKHNYGWVFNKPVDAFALRLHDYHDIIKQPMDLGTVKMRLSQNWYKSPREFAEDVRLVFRNAMTYNPKGQDVHIMADQMSKMFEERWADIESEYNPNWSLQVYHDSGLPTPTSTKTAPPTFVPTPILAAGFGSQTRTFDRSESLTRSADTKMKPSVPYRTPVPKKPKAKDPNKRDMTYEEKQKLSTNLQSLPSEKLDAIVQIIKKRNSTLSQHDDEIEVDIDSVDAETLWELDRFVTNYKKSLSKNRKKAEIARARAAQTAPVSTPYPVVADSQKASRGGKGNYSSAASPAGQGETQVDNASRSSSSSSSSSSDSGSSSSDSDSDSSSAYGSDAGR
ncbi:unnamed protein product [Cuscuta europaea]|uniref:Uncharacterized protein n=1 Tax=Cuscuta europaea TaxID=41803 RepID=A0A9P0ZPP5_CUSEU|nr:unnamed protein product [Cuscuta europaea]